jgi:hypothetical protein
VAGYESPSCIDANTLHPFVVIALLGRDGEAFHHNAGLRYRLAVVRGVVCLAVHSPYRDLWDGPSNRRLTIRLHITAFVDSVQIL